jgi:purine-binding chemotaxis protein CheW
MNDASRSTAADASTEPVGEFLTFTLGTEEYGVEILKVQEIRGYDSVTRLPGAPDFIKGAINLRGTIVPVVDMRVKFGLPQVSYDDTTVMIVLNVADRIVGVVVDSVSDVIRLEAAQVRETPDLGGAIDRKFLTGIGVVDDRMLVLLDIERLMTSSEMGLVDEALAA